MMDLTEGERAHLKAIREGEGWKVLEKIMKFHEEMAIRSLSQTDSDHRYFQGKLHQVYLLKHSFEDWANETPKPNSTGVSSAFVRRKSDSTLDY